MLLLWSVVVAGGQSELSGWIFLRPFSLSSWYSWGVAGLLSKAGV